MKKITFKRQLLFVMLMLLGCLSIQAADDGLITNQVVITLDSPGTLPQKISASDKYLITNLKVKGDINGTDLGFLREMAGQSINGEDETNANYLPWIYLTPRLSEVESLILTMGVMKLILQNITKLASMLFVPAII